MGSFTKNVQTTLPLFNPKETISTNVISLIGHGLNFVLALSLIASWQWLYTIHFDVLCLVFDFVDSLTVQSWRKLFLFTITDGLADKNRKILDKNKYDTTWKWNIKK